MQSVANSAAAERLDYAEPLRDERYERFAHLRLIGIPHETAAWAAGFHNKRGKPLLPGNSARLDRHPDIIGRKAYLAGHETAILRETRGFIRQRLMNVVTRDLLRDFAIIGDAVVPGVIDEAGQPMTIRRVIGIDWDKLKASDHSATVTSFKFDRETGMMTEFVVDDPMAAIAQLRDMFGLKAPRRTELTGKDGAPIQTAEIVRYEISDQPMSIEDWTQQYVPAPRSENTGDSPSGTDCSTCEAELAPNQLGAEHNRAAASGSRLTFESRRGFPTGWTHASLAYANRNFHHSQARRSPPSEGAGAGSQCPTQACLASRDRLV